MLVAGISLGAGVAITWRTASAGTLLLKSVKGEVTGTGLVRLRSDLREATAAVDELRDRALPGWAGELHETGGQLRGELGALHPNFEAGLAAADEIAAFTDRGISNLEAHRRDAAAAEKLPGRSASYAAVAAGMLLVLLGVGLLLRPGRLVAFAALIVALGVVVTPLATRLPSRLAGAERLAASLHLDRSVAAGTRARLRVVQAFARDVDPVLTDVAARLGIPKSDLLTRIQRQYPSLARGLNDFTPLLRRFEARARIRESAVGHFAVVRNAPLRAYPWLAIVPGLLAAIAAFAAIMSQRRGRSRASASEDAGGHLRS